MKLQDAKGQFIQVWSRLAGEWGISRTMAQVHALLLASEAPLSTDDVMEQLTISRGNASMTLRDLAGWNLIYIQTKPGDRRDYYRAEKDMWEVAKRIARERKKRELEPLLAELTAMERVDEKTSEAKAFVAVVKDTHALAGKVDKSLDAMIKADEHWFFGAILKLLK